MGEKINRRDFLQKSAAAVGAVNVMDTDFSKAMMSGSDLTANSHPTQILGKTGRKVSRIGFGGGSPFWQNVESDNLAERLIEYAIQIGVTYYDTAFSYGKDSSSEKRLGKFLTPKYRDKIFLVSKSRPRTYDGVMREFEQSLKHLNTDYLDLYLMHALKTIEDVEQLGARNGGYKAFRKLKDEGSIKHIGFSFHTWEEFSKRAYDEFDPEVVMFSLNASRDSGCEEHFLSLAQERNTGLVAMKVTASNSLIGKVSGQELVRYTLSLPVHVLNIGIDGFGTLESCVRLAQEKPLNSPEREEINKRLAYSPDIYKIPYHDPDYEDGYFA